jgi:CheY-like chemotaxis protein
MAKILIVDDEPVIRLLYQEELEDEGYEVLTADGGQGLLNKIESEKPDLVVLDIKMADCDGLDLCQDIKNRFSSLTVIMCTAYSSFRNDSRALMADFYVVKSADLTELKTKIKIATTLTESQVLNEIESRLKLLLNQYQSDVPLSKSHPEFIKLMTEFKDNGYLNFSSPEEVQSLLSTFTTVFSREIRKATNILRRFATRYGEIKPVDGVKLYEPSGQWSVLSMERFMDVSNDVSREIRKDFDWLKIHLEDILYKIKENAFETIPFEALISALRMQKPLEPDDQNVMDIFLSDLRHDFKNKLRNLKLILSELKEINLDSSTAMSSVVELLDDLSDLHSQLVSINDRLYDISYFKVATLFTGVDLSQLIDRILTDTGLKDSKKIRVEVACTQIQANTDPNFLGIILRQVIQNSVEALQDNGFIKISVTPEPAEKTIMFLVEDNGCGIAKNRLDKLFSQDAGSTKKGHSGIGLTLARMAAASLGGTIRITSKINAGTQVIIKIPWER